MPAEGAGGPPGLLPRVCVRVYTHRERETITYYELIPTATR